MLATAAQGLLCQHYLGRDTVYHVQPSGTLRQSFSMEVEVLRKSSTYSLRMKGFLVSGIGLFLPF